VDEEAPETKAPPSPDQATGSKEAENGPCLDSNSDDQKEKPLSSKEAVATNDMDESDWSEFPFGGIRIVPSNSDSDSDDSSVPFQGRGDRRRSTSDFGTINDQQQQRVDEDRRWSTTDLSDESDHSSGPFRMKGWATSEYETRDNEEKDDSKMNDSSSRRGVEDCKRPPATNYAHYTLRRVVKDPTQQQAPEPSSNTQQQHVPISIPVIATIEHRTATPAKEMPFSSRFVQYKLALLKGDAPIPPEEDAGYNLNRVEETKEGGGAIHNHSFRAHDHSERSITRVDEAPFPWAEANQRASNVLGYKLTDEWKEKASKYTTSPQKRKKKKKGFLASLNASLPALNFSWQPEEATNTNKSSSLSSPNNKKSGSGTKPNKAAFASTTNRALHESFSSLDNEDMIRHFHREKKRKIKERIKKANREAEAAGYNNASNLPPTSSDDEDGGGRSSSINIRNKSSSSSSSWDLQDSSSSLNSHDMLHNSWEKKEHNV
jgi:hypothetical protein